MGDCEREVEKLQIVDKNCVMKFSSLEQKVIQDLCDWAQEANDFKSIRNFFSDKALPEATGLFTFSSEFQDRPPIILCVNIDKYTVDTYSSIYNHILFLLHFLKKLEQYGLVTISKGRYSEDEEYGIATFSGLSVIGIRKMQGNEWGYSCTVVNGGNAVPSELIKNGLTLRRSDDKLALPFYNVEVFTRFDGFDLISSSIALEQELFELVSNGFKTTEELMLETAGNQLATAKDILIQAEKQSKLALDDINQAKANFEAAQKTASEQFETEQNNANLRFEKEQANARKNLEDTQAELERRFNESQAASERQYNESQAESKRQYNDAKDESIRQFNEAKKDSKEQFEKAQKHSRCALVLAALSILVSPFVAMYVDTTIDETQYRQIESVQTEMLKMLKEINLEFTEVDPETTINVVQEQLDEISTTLKKINSKLARPTQK